MNEFLTFILTGKIESFEDNAKEKALYFLKILYYTFAMLFAIALVHGLIVYIGISSIDWAILDKIGNQREMHSVFKSTPTTVLLYLVISPLVLSYAFWYCLTDFDLKKVALSFSLIMGIAFLLVAKLLNIIPPIEGYYIGFILSAAAIIFIAYFASNKIISPQKQEKIAEFWNKNLKHISLFIVLLYTLYSFDFTDLHLGKIIIGIVRSVFMAFMFIYVRRLLGFWYTVGLYYILACPFIILQLYNILH